MSEFVPKLKQLKVSPDKLILDPNNPRLITRSEDTYDERQALDLMDNTISKMRGTGDKDNYNIKELENSIKENGWWPIDFIFVKKFDSDGRFIVLEGNRRVTAIKNLRNDLAANNPLRKSLDLIDVMEIIDDIPLNELQKKIVYLLGVRHHGSLKKWTPFAQAHNIYQRYIDLKKISRESFTWDTDVAQEVADALSIDNGDVKDRLKVFRAMEQAGNDPDIKASESNGGGIKDRYYSVFAEVLLTTNKQLREYISQDNQNFLLDNESVKRMNNLCHFDKPGRSAAPIGNPQEWRKLANILKEQDPVKKAQMLEEVEVNKIAPSIVWASRAAELQAIQWDKWLMKVNTILKKVTFGDDLTSDAAKETTMKLINVIRQLDQKDIN